MKHAISLPALFATLALAACDRPTTVVNPAPAPAPVAVQVPVPGPAGPAGPAGEKGAPGRPGDGTTVVVVPPASAASN